MATKKVQRQGRKAYILATLEQVRLFGEHASLSEGVSVPAGPAKVQVTMSTEVALGWVDQSGTKQLGIALKLDIQMSIEATGQQICIYSNDFRAIFSVEDHFGVETKGQVTTDLAQTYIRQLEFIARARAYSCFAQMGLDGVKLPPHQRFDADKGTK